LKHDKKQAGRSANEYVPSLGIETDIEPLIALALLEISLTGCQMPSTSSTSHYEA
jgi:hypothetical protein